MSEQPTPLTIERLYALRYLTIAGLTVLIYDALLTFAEELKFIWFPILKKTKRKGIRKLAIPRPILLYLIARYCMLLIGLLYLYDLIPSRDLTINWSFYLRLETEGQLSRCQGSAVFIFSIDVIVEVLSCGVVLHQLFQLWQFSPVISRIVLVSFFFSKVVLFAFAASAIVLIKKYVTFVSVGNVRSCGITGSSRLFLGVWITCVTFDVLAFALLLLNALSKPRSESQRLLNILYEDGIIFFLTIFSMSWYFGFVFVLIINIIIKAMRSMNLIISAAAPPSLIILGIVFSASMVSTVVSRSFLRLQKRLNRDHTKLLYNGDETFFEDDDGGYILKSNKETNIDDNTLRSSASSSGN
ncbi:hypothetical protein ACEPAG_8931 [Sanghuangporus baumii]